MKLIKYITPVAFTMSLCLLLPSKVFAGETFLSKEIVSSISGVPLSSVGEISSLPSEDIPGAKLIRVEIKKDNYVSSKEFYMVGGAIFPRPRVILSLDKSPSKDEHQSILSVSQDVTPSKYNISSLDPVLKKSIIWSGNEYATSDKIIYEFLDYQCPSCKMVHPYLKSWLKEHPSYKVIYIDYPLTNIHPYAAKMSIMVNLARLFDKRLAEDLREAYLRIPSSADMSNAVPYALSRLLDVKYSSKKVAFLKFASEKFKSVSDDIESRYKLLGYIPGTPFFIDSSGKVLPPSLNGKKLILK